MGEHKRKKVGLNIARVDVNSGPIIHKSGTDDILIWIGAPNSPYPGFNQINVTRCQAELDIEPLSEMEKFGLEKMLPIAKRVG